MCMFAPGVSKEQKAAQKAEAERVAEQKRVEQAKIREQKSESLESADRMAAARQFSLALKKSFQPVSGARTLYNRTSSGGS